MSLCDYVKKEDCKPIREEKPGSYRLDSDFLGIRDEIKVSKGTYNLPISLDAERNYGIKPASYPSKMGGGMEELSRSMRGYGETIL